MESVLIEGILGLNKNIFNGNIFTLDKLDKDCRKYLSVVSLCSSVYQSWEGMICKQEKTGKKKKQKKKSKHSTITFWY